MPVIAKYDVFLCGYFKGVRGTLRFLVLRFKAILSSSFALKICAFLVLVSLPVLDFSIFEHSV